MTKPELQLFDCGKHPMIQMQHRCPWCEIKRLQRLCARVVEWQPPFPVESGLLDELAEAGRAANEPNEAVQAGAEDSQVGSLTADSSPPLPR